MLLTENELIGRLAEADLQAINALIYILWNCDAGGCYWEGGKVCKENLVKIETEAIDRAVWQQILTILPAGNGQIYQGHHFMALAFLQYNLWFLPKTDLKRKSNFQKVPFLCLSRWPFCRLEMAKYTRDITLWLMLFFIYGFCQRQIWNHSGA